MATKTFIGNVGTEGVATGPHIHQYVKNLKTGEYIDPRTLMSPLLNVVVGEKEIPLAIKDRSGKITINPLSGATITSEFGPRSAPTAGASSDHRGRDIALPYGTPVKFLGAGKFTPQTGVQGFGNLGVLTTPDNQYEIGFGHMSSLGKPADFTGTLGQDAAAPRSNASWEDVYNASQQRTSDLLEAFMYGAKFGKGTEEKSRTPKDFLSQAKQQLMQSMLGGTGPLFGGQAATFDPSQINAQLSGAIFG